MTIDGLQRRIDRLDYSLYNLTAQIMDEIFNAVKYCIRKNDKYGLIHFANMVDRWQSSINNINLYSGDNTINQIKITNIKRTKTNLQDLKKRIDKIMPVKVVKINQNHTGDVDK